jgi:hypothetical protein
VVNKKGRLTSKEKKKHSFSKKEVNLPYGKLSGTPDKSRANKSPKRDRR